MKKSELPKIIKILTNLLYLLYNFGLENKEDKNARNYKSTQYFMHRNFKFN